MFSIGFISGELAAQFNPSMSDKNKTIWKIIKSETGTVSKGDVCRHDFDVDMLNEIWSMRRILLVALMLMEMLGPYNIILIYVRFHKRRNKFSSE